MLSISRRVGERILIGDGIVVEVLEVSGGGVRLGITAPAAQRIYREELWERVKAENEAAAQGDFKAPKGRPDRG
ncbi:MAG: hypothetical protein BGO11_06405 [Solirubrobacterales bacterium 70-9]|nr:MAG: hypothetical protein BGO11_06405 [Solirubrobacterales bacterium 70-9]